MNELPLGQIVATANASATLTPEDIASGIQRHRNKDWGEVVDEDRRINDDAVMDGDRILSAYRTTKGVKFWIITEWDRSVTTVLLPEDY